MYICRVLRTAFTVLVKVTSLSLFSCILVFFAVKPRIMSKMNDIRVKVGQPFKIDVEFIGEPPPQVEWTVTGKVSAAIGCLHSMLMVFKGR